MSFETTIKTEALKQFKPGKLRKRYLVSEGDLFQLYKDIQLIRSKEDKTHLMANFKTLLKQAQQVKLTVTKKGGDFEH